MVQMYCVKCKSKTGTSSLYSFQSKNKKWMIGGKCTKCGIKKTRFAKNEETKKGGFVFTLPMLAAAAGIAASAATAGSSIATAVNNKKAQDKKLAEEIRHNKAMEGKGFRLNPPPSYKRGGGLYLNRL